MALSLGAEGVDYLDPGQFQSFVSYRWLEADTGYIGTDEWDDYKRLVGSDIKLHSVDVNLTYALTRRFSLSLTAPFIYGRVTSHSGAGGPGLPRRTTHGSGLGDIRLTANAWLFDPDTSPKGNVVLGLGVKAPTGNDDVTDTFHRRDGSQFRHGVDIAIQPGDGGWGALLEMQSFRSLTENLYFYATGFYLANPREQNGTTTTYAGIGEVENSVPDQYQARAGLSVAVWPHQGLALSLGGRIDGIPTYDLIGGSDGFRRPGYSIYVEPGLSLSRGKTMFSLYVPVGVAYDRRASKLDKETRVPGSISPTNGNGPGAFADYLIVFSISRQF